MGLSAVVPIVVQLAALSVPGPLTIVKLMTVPAGAFTVPARSLLSLSVPSWPEADCPLCRKGVPIDAPGSRFASR